MQSHQEHQNWWKVCNLLQTCAKANLSSIIPGTFSTENILPYSVRKRKNMLLPKFLRKNTNKLYHNWKRTNTASVWKETFRHYRNGQHMRLFEGTTCFILIRNKKFLFQNNFKIWINAGSYKVFDTIGYTTGYYPKHLLAFNTS